MSYLTINGISVGVALTSVSKTREVLGAGISRAQDGSARNNFNGKKWRFKAKTTPLTQTEGMFLRALLDGLGDHWTFDADLYSDKGSLSSGGSTRGTATPSPKYGAGYLLTGNNITQTFPIDSVADGWTLLAWTYESAAWHHYVGWGASGSVNGGTWLRDGVSHAAPTWWQSGAGLSSATGTVLTIDCVNDFVTEFIDDLVIIPAQCSAAQASALYAFHNAQAWPTPYPSLKVGGDFHPVALTMMGQPGDAQTSEVFLSGALQDNAIELSFDLLEA